MANGVELATAYVSLMPSFSGLKKAIAGELGDAATEAGKRAGDDVGEGVAKGSEEGASRGGRSIKDGLTKALEGVKGAAGGILGDLGIGATLAAVGAGAMAASQTKAALQAKLGLSPKESAALGKTAGKIYADNWGESMGDVSDSLAIVKQNLAGLGNVNLKTVTEQALAFKQTFGTETEESIRAVAQMLRTGMAKNATQAFDILTAGEQKGADKAGDLMDTMNEYGTQFRKLGLTGKTAMGLISQGLQNGARDSDIVADSLKEFSIRAVDGSTTTAQGFKMLGLDAQTMSGQIAKGGTSATKGLQTTLDALRNIKDPAKQSQAAVALFGTQAEDLGQALYSLDPSKATKAMGDVSGKTKDMSDAISKTANPLEQLKRDLQGAAVEAGGDLLPVLEPLLSLAGKMGPEIVAVALAWTGLSAAMKVTRAVSDAKTFVQESKVLGSMTTQLGRVRDGFKSAGAAESTFSGKAGSLGGSLRKVVDGLKAAVKAAAQWVAETAKAAAKGFVNALKSVGSAAKTAAEALVRAAKAALSWVAAAAKAAGKAFATALTAVGKAATTSAVALGRAVKAAVLWVAQQVRAAASTVANTVAMVAQRAAIIGITIASKAWTTAQWLLNAALDANPIGLIVIAIAALVTAFILAYKHSETFRNIVNGAFGAIKNVVEKVLPAIKTVIVTVFNAIKGFFTTVFGVYKKIFVGAWNVIKSATTTAFRAIKGFITNPISSAKAVLSGILSKIRAAVSGAWNAIKSATSHAFSGVKSLIVRPFNEVVSFIRGIPGKIRGLGSAFASAGKHVISSLLNGLKAAGSVVSDIAGNVWSTIKGSLNSVLSHLRSALSFTVHIGPFSKHIAVPIPALATGARATGATLAMIGEGSEPETVFPDSKLAGFLERMTAAATQNLGAAPATAGGTFALTITNWEEGTGYIEQLADGRVDAASQMAGMLGRAS